MKAKWTGSIAFKLAVYAVVSMILTVVTEFLVLLLLRYIRSSSLFSTGNADTVQNVLQNKAALGSTESAQSLLLLQITRYAGWNLAILLGMTLVLFLLYYILITRPIVDEVRILLAGLELMKKGDLTIDFPVRSEDEFGRLAQSLNEVQHAILRIQMQERRQEHAKDELITNVAHDLRTPLTSLKGYVDLLSKEDLDRQQRERYVNILASKTAQLQSLIESLFEYTKYSGGEVRFYMQPMNVSRFMEQLTDEFYEDFLSAGLRCETRITPELHIRGDGEKLARAFNNIFSNAIKYGRDGKLVRVYVRADEVKHMAVIEVVNYGVLVEPGDVQRMFEKFYRAESSRSKDTGGSGLGLAITKTIIERHKGTVCAMSNGAGTVIQVCLPVI